MPIMPIMPDSRNRETAENKGMIDPFIENLTRGNVISHGCARRTIMVNLTPFEPEWKGHVTPEFSDTTPLPARAYANEGVCQFLSLEGESVRDMSYNDREGYYQGQQGVTLPKGEKHG